jgi:TolB protein
MRGFAGGLVIISATALVACSGSSKGTATSAAPSAHVALPALGVEAPASQIPWNQVGPGWILATWSPTPGPTPGQTPPDGEPPPAPVTLYLLDPAGGRYAITTLALSPSQGPGDPGHTPRLVDWSGDGRHALFEDMFAVGGNTAMTEVDLATGAKQTFTVSGQSNSFAYSRPTGQTLLRLNANPDGRSTSTLERVDLSGTTQSTFPTDQLGAAGKFNDGYLQTPDGSQLVLGADKGMMVVGNDGVVARQLPMPGPRSDCRPVRWWTSAVILAACDNPPPPPGTPVGGGESQLWQVPVAGGAPTPLTPLDDGLGYMDAWQLPSGTFLRNVPGCGGDGLLFRLTPDMQVKPVTVPGADSTKAVVGIGVTGDKLVVEASTGCGARTRSLLLYDPAANTATVLLAGVQGAILYGGA